MAGNTLALGISNAGPVATIVNGFSAGGTSTTSVAASAAQATVEVQAAGAYSATPGTLQTLLAHTGRGRINLLTVYAKNATARTLRLKLTIDGVAIFDATSNSVSASATGMVVVGVYGSAVNEFQPIDYNESLLIEVASSVASDAAANIGIAVNRETWVS